MFRILNKYIDYNHTLEACKLDRVEYGENDCMPAEQIKGWFEKNPEGTTILLDNEKLVGYITFLPISNDFYNKFKAGEKKDVDLFAKDVLNFEQNKHFHCLLVSFLVSKKYRNTQASTYLINAFYNKIKNIIKTRNIKIESIITYAVNPKIEELLINSDFTFVIGEDTGKVYEGNIF